jgi:hypothetical protein
MGSMVLRSVLVTAVLAAAGPAASAGEYSDPSGFSFTYPDGWVVLTGDQTDAALQSLPPAIKQYLDRNKLDLSKMKVSLIRNATDEFLENLNVVVEDQQVPTTQDAVKKLTDMITKQYAAAGIRLIELNGSVQKVAGRDALVFDSQVVYPHVTTPVKLRQVAFPGGGKTYTVTCGGPAARFEQYRPVFERMLESFRVPPVKGFNWGAVSSGAVIGAISGAVAGVLIGLIFLIKKLTGRKKARPRRREYDEYVHEDDDDRPRKRARRDDDEDDDDRPRKRARRDDDEEDDERPRKRARRDDDEEDDERPRKRARRDDDDNSDDQDRDRRTRRRED